MLSKAQVKDIRGLATIKGRVSANAFVAEGDKIGREWLQSGNPIQLLAATKEWLTANEAIVGAAKVTAVETLGQDELSQLSSLSSPQQVLLVINKPDDPQKLPVDEWALALDDVQDPGNVGTLVRIADWFGIRHVVASPGCADFYNPKVIQAAMGGHLRVSMHVCPLTDFIKKLKIPAIAATLNGENVYHFIKPPAAALVIGNESRGISPAVQELCRHKVSIPRNGGAESLNAAVSAGILCALLLPGY